MLRSLLLFVGILLDTKGPEIRSGFFADGAKKISLTKGETITLTSDYDFKGNNKKLACSYKTLASSVKPGQSILVADDSHVITVFPLMLLLERLGASAGDHVVFVHGTVAEAGATNAVKIEHVLNV